MKTSDDKLSASLEDYLECILTISEKKGAARAKDISMHIGVSGASVTRALQKLQSKGLINYAPYDVVTLTHEGMVIAKDISKKHMVLFEFFKNVLVIEEADSEELACKMEHIIPDNILERFVEFAEFVGRCPNRGAIWKENAHGYFCQSHGDDLKCDECNMVKAMKTDSDTEA